MSIKKTLLATMLLALPLSHALAQPAVIIDSKRLDAVVESIDPAGRSALLRDSNDRLITVHGGPGMQNFPRVKAGDMVEIFTSRLLSANIAKPGEPLPESTTTGASNRGGAMPNGLVVNRTRTRVKIEAIDLAKNTVTFSEAGGEQRVAPVRVKAMQDFLRTLKVGDEVDVTFTDAVTVVVKGKAAS